MSPVLLAFDSSTERIHLGVVAGARRAAFEAPGGAQASAQLLPLARAALADWGLTWSDVDAVGFGQGPGAFTGLRTACALAQGLALGLDVPVLALPTLAAVAEHARQLGASGPVWAAHDARMGEVYAAWWVDVDGQWQAPHGQLLCPPEDLLDHMQAQPGTPAGAAFRDVPALRAAHPHAMTAATPVGMALAELAQAAFARGQGQDADQALPLYVRDKVAQTMAERAKVGP